MVLTLLALVAVWLGSKWFALAAMPQYNGLYFSLIKLSATRGEPSPQGPVVLVSGVSAADAFGAVEPSTGVATIERARSAVCADKDDGGYLVTISFASGKRAPNDLTLHGQPVEGLFETEGESSKIYVGRLQSSTSSVVPLARPESTRFFLRSIHLDRPVSSVDWTNPPDFESDYYHSGVLVKCFVAWRAAGFSGSVMQARSNGVVVETKKIGTEEGVDGFVRVVKADESP